MSVIKRGGVYWYEFQFMGQRIRESAHTGNRELARSIERTRRKAMEESAGGVSGRNRCCSEKPEKPGWQGMPTGVSPTGNPTH